MKDSLINFLHELGCNLDEWKQQELDVIKVIYFSHSEEAIIKLAIDRPLNIALLKALEQAISTSEYTISCEFNLANGYQAQDAFEYFEYIKTFKLGLIHGFFYNLQPSDLSFDNNVLTIKVTNNIEANLVAAHARMFLSYFNNYGFKGLSLVCQIVQQTPAFDNQKILEDAIALVQSKESFKSSSTYKPSSSYFGSSKTLDLDPKLSNTHAIKDLIADFNDVIISGKIFKISKFQTKAGKWFFSFWVTDNKSAIVVKAFSRGEAMDKKLNMIEENKEVKFRGSVKFDTYSKDFTLNLVSFALLDTPLIIREDNAVNKRVEFHIHTKLSAMDGITSATDYINQVGKWGHKAVAFSDHYNVQAFPEIAKAATKYPDLKVIYGVEMQMIDQQINSVANVGDTLLSQGSYLIFDLETTGLSPGYNEIIEFGYVVLENNVVVQQDTMLIKPKNPVPAFITSLTHITDEMLVDKPSITDVLPQIKALISDRILVAHNASFDMGFLNAAMNQHQEPPLTNSVIDTLMLARILLPQAKSHRLGKVCQAFGVKYDDGVAHRADYDAHVLAGVFLKMIKSLEADHQCYSLEAINALDQMSLYNKTRGKHVNVFAKNQAGIKDLYNLVSLSHTDQFYGNPKIFREALAAKRTDLLIGSSCVNSEVFEAAREKNQAKLSQVLSFYDFVEVQPPSVYQNLIEDQSFNLEQLCEIIKTIIFAAKSAGKLIIASSDAHYLHPWEKVFREIIINSKGIGGELHPLSNRRDKVSRYPDQHLRTTPEMLDEFKFLNDEGLIQEIVISNTHTLAAQFEKVKPLQDRLFTPIIAGSDEKLKQVCYENATKIYGHPLPKIVNDRLERELNAITTHGFGVIYWIAHKLVEKSLQDGYLVGSRGSVGSSLVATLANITEVNPLSAHYYCKKCQYNEFIESGEVKCGYDLPDKLCPTCQTLLTGEGHDIPFETFLGFEGDKTPDIDLNFSGEYQSQAHDFTKQMFGEESVYRAGTISTIASRTAFGYCKAYLENIGSSETKSAWIEFLSQGLVGIKRTTGQHPGGIIVIPKEYHVSDFSPVNYPADDNGSAWKTTHFEFEALHDNLLKLDLLGHVDPTALKMLHDLTGIDPKSITNHDIKVLSLFSNLNALGISSENIRGEKTGAIGIPEFGTSFVRSMLTQTQPQSFADLVQISGLSHGTDVWSNNAQDLIANNTIKLKDAIGCRDDIMVYLMYQGLPAKQAFNIMESVRKGKGLSAEQEELMSKNRVPKWYIQTCKKIKYMFPKAHATAYVLMAWRVAWYKVYYPYEYYATYFSTRCSVFDVKTMLSGTKGIVARLKELEEILKKDSYKSTTHHKERELQSMLEVCMEMYARGIEFANISLDFSDAAKFKIIEENNTRKILPPFICLDGLGEVVARGIIELRSEALFKQRDELLKVPSMSKTTRGILDEMGILAHLS